MRTGAVVMIDALGFKGIWDGADPSVILRKMGALKQAAESDIKGVKLGHVRGAKVAFLSDTIVIGVASGQPVGRGPGPNKRGNVRAIMQAAFQTASVLAAALEEAPRLAYRGCLTFGEFEIDGPFVLGPAIDEAATHYECADGAFVWLTPKAKAIADADADTSYFQSAPAVCFVVPLKAGASFETWTVTPFGWRVAAVDRQDVAERLLGTFDRDPKTRDRMDVAVKRQNTRRFLEQALGSEVPPPSRRRMSPAR